MKGKIRLVGILLLTVILAVTLAACNGGNDDNDNTPKAPTQSDWSAVGIDGGFSAEVKGNLVTNLAVEGEIQMKWTDSDETSLDNTIAWLKSKGFSSYGGATATKESLQDGALLSYTAEKSVSAVAHSAKALSFAIAAASAENAVVAETLYVARDVSLMGMSYKAGELYLSVAPGESTPAPGPSTEWPAQTIASIIGDGVPVYTGAASSISAQSNTLVKPTVTVSIAGASNADYVAYRTALAQAGFSDTPDGFIKTKTNGDIITVQVAEGSGTILISVTLEKNSGALTEYPSNRLTAFNGANLPAYSGGTSYDCEDIVSSYSATIKTSLQQSIATLEALGANLTDEQRTQLAEYKEKLKLIDNMRAFTVTVYGTTDGERSAFCGRLTANGFTLNGGTYVKDFSNPNQYQAQVDVGDVENGKLLLTLIRMPAELLDDEGGDPVNPPVTDELTFADLPTNIKITFEYLVNGIKFTESTATKIGDNWLIESASYGTTVKSYLKKSGNVWTEYAEVSGVWTAGGSYTALSDHDVLKVLTFIFNNDVSGFTKGQQITITGQACDVYTKTDDSLASYGITTVDTLYVNADGFVLYNDHSNNQQGQTTTQTNQITLWDTTVTSFDDIMLP